MLAKVIFLQIREENLKRIAKLPKVTDFFNVQASPSTSKTLESQELPTCLTSDNIILANDNNDKKNENSLTLQQNENQELLTSSSSSNTSLLFNKKANDDQNTEVSKKKHLSVTEEKNVLLQETKVEQDPSLWPEAMTDHIRHAYLNKGPEYFQNNDGKFKASMRKCSKQNRSLSARLFESRQLNGESFIRRWLLYSKSNGSVYCFVCKLFCSDNNSSLFISGFSNWKRAEEKVKAHENCLEHRKSLLTWKTYSTSHKVDDEMTESLNKQVAYWKNVFKRLIEVIKFIAERSLAFRGDDERLGSPHNGNYLGILELISKFDPFLSQHLEHFGQKGKGSVSYLSKTICEELISCMGRKVYNQIIAEIKQAKYYSIVVDSTPDLSHIDQLSIIFRYCLNGKVLERFLCFIPIHSHTGKSLADEILSLLETNLVKIENCRGQTYDNASNMSGKYKGVQAEIKKRNKLAHYVPCAAHSLNLVGESSVDECVEATSFFGFLQKLYAFFVASTHRWEILIKNIKKQNEECGDHTRLLTVKQLSTTRWSSREQAVKSLVINYDGIFNALKQLAEDTSEKKDTRNDAFSLKNHMVKLETAFMATFWKQLLERFDATNTYLQKPGLDVITGHKMLVSLLEFVGNLRSQFESLEEKAKDISSVLNPSYKDAYRRRSVKKLADGSTEISRQGQDQFRIESFLPMIDKITSELKKRTEAYKEISDLFGFFSQLTILSSTEISATAKSLISQYPNDLDENLAYELIQFSSYLITLNTESVTSVPFLLSHLIEKDLLEIFPNTYIALRIYLCIPITNCESERSFSKLALIKNKYRATMGEVRLSSLALMSIENDLLSSIDFSDIINTFSTLKARKKTF